MGGTEKAERAVGREREPQVLTTQVKTKVTEFTADRLPGERGHIGSLEETTLCALEILSHTMEDPVMEAIDLNNLEQYFTIIYTMSVPNHMLHCVHYCTKSKTPSFRLKRVLLVPFKTLAHVPNV